MGLLVLLLNASRWPTSKLLQISNRTKNLGLNNMARTGRPVGAINKDKPFRAALVRALGIADNNPEKLDKLAEALIAKAKTGDVAALREVSDRLDGKVAQAVVGDDGSEPITLRTIVTGVIRPGD